MNGVTALTNAFTEAGFTLIRARKHHIWRCPCGHTQIASSGSPCRGRGASNCKAQIRRTLRECQQLTGC